MVELHGERNEAKREGFPSSVIYGALGALVLVVLAIAMSVAMGSSFQWLTFGVLVVSVPALFMVSIAAIRRAGREGRGWLAFFGFAAMMLAIFMGLVVVFIVWSSGSSM